MVDRGELRVVPSVITLAEVLVHPLRSRTLPRLHCFLFRRRLRNECPTFERRTMRVLPMPYSWRRPSNLGHRRF
jgi:hypothetical protein